MSFIKDQALDHYSNRKPFRYPFIILDSQSEIAYASPGITSITGYDPKELVAPRKHFREYLSSHLYVDALRPMANRIAIIAEQEGDVAVVQRRVTRFREDLHDLHLISPEGKEANVRKIIADFRQSPLEKLIINSAIPLRKKDGTGVVFQDDVYLYKHPTSYGLDYAGALITLAMPVEERMKKLHLTWVLSAVNYVANLFKLPVYRIKDEPTVVIEGLAKPEDVITFNSRLIQASHLAKAEHIVLDFTDVQEIDPVAFTRMFDIVIERAQRQSVVFGNASKEVIVLAEQALHTKYDKKAARVQAHRLQWPDVREPVIDGPQNFRELKTHLELEAFIEQHIGALESRYANTVPEQRVPPVQDDTAGKGIDVPATGKGAPEQP